MMKPIAALALSAALVFPAVSAFASDTPVNLTDEVKAEIKTMLEGQGYEVGKIKTEDGLYEAYAKKDGQKLEILLDGDLKILKTEVD